MDGSSDVCSSDLSDDWPIVGTAGPIVGTAESIIGNRTVNVSTKTVGGADECVPNSRLGGCVSRVGNNVQLRVGPCAMQVPGIHQRTDNVVTSMNDYRRNVTNAIDILDQVIVSFEEAVVDKVVTLDSRERDRLLRFGKLVDRFL